YGLGPDFDTGGNYPGFDVAPERDEQLACQGHNGDPSRAPSQSTDALAGPFCQLAAGLGGQPEPCELDHGRPCTRVASPANAPIAVHTTALVGHRRDADVAGDLSAVAELTVEYLTCWHGREVIPDPPESTQTDHLDGVAVLRRGREQLVTLGRALSGHLHDPDDTP